MTNKAEEKKALLIDKIVTALGQRLPADVAPLAQVFAGQYFTWVSPEDLLRRVNAADADGASRPPSRGCSGRSCCINTPIFS